MQTQRLLIYLDGCREGPEPPGLSDDYIMDFVIKHRGSISAEHGLGQLKNEYLGDAKPAAVVDAMRDVKDLFDPNHILNPFKFFPPPPATA